jgi:SAM-dependent methyltransferase
MADGSGKMSRGAMVGVDSYMMSGAETDSESTRLRNIQQASDSFTIKHLEATGIGQGWRCLEIGAGGGSIAGWLGDRVGATGSVVATDVDLQRLGDLGAPVEVRRHDIAREGLESAAYDLVHCRLVLQHLTEPVVVLQKVATAVAPGGWLVVEEGDFGLLEFAGAAESPRASIVLRDVFTRWAAAGVIDSYLGRRLPGLVAPSMSRRSASMLSPRSADPATQPTKRFAWPGRPPAREPRRSASPRTTCAVSTGLSPIPPSSSASPFSPLGASYHAPATNVVHTCRRTAAAPRLRM